MSEDSIALHRKIGALAGDFAGMILKTESEAAFYKEQCEKLRDALRVVAFTDVNRNNRKEAMAALASYNQTIEEREKAK